jgi:hypothetical protein
MFYFSSNFTYEHMVIVDVYMRGNEQIKAIWYKLLCHIGSAVISSTKCMYFLCRLNMGSGPLGPDAPRPLLTGPLCPNVLPITVDTYNILKIMDTKCW